MKKTFYTLLTLFLLNQTILLGQSTDSTISYVATWQKGDSKKYKVTKKKIEYRNGKVHKDETTTYISKFEVTAANKKSYDIEYQYENQLFTNAPQLTSEIKAVSAKHKIQKVKYKTDEFGAFKGIENWKEISAMTKEMFAAVIKASPNQEKEKLMNAMKPMIDGYSSKEGIESHLLAELIYFHSPYGGMFNLNDTLTYNDTYPNLYGGAPLKAVGKLYYNRTDFAGNKSRMIMEVKLDKTDVLRMVEEMMASMASKMAAGSKEEQEQKLAQMRKEFSQMKMDMKDYNTYVYNSDTGWPISISYKRNTSVQASDGNFERIDEVIVEELD